jgi:hypothetical protein
MGELSSAFENWEDHHDKLNAIAKFFSMRARLDRFTDVCIEHNPKLTTARTFEQKPNSSQKHCYKHLFVLAAIAKPSSLYMCKYNNNNHSNINNTNNKNKNNNSNNDNNNYNNNANNTNHNNNNNNNNFCEAAQRRSFMTMFTKCCPSLVPHRWEYLYSPECFVASDHMRGPPVFVVVCRGGV